MVWPLRANLLCDMAGVVPAIRDWTARALQRLVDAPHKSLPLARTGAGHDDQGIRAGL
jgi:hypothetical protein